MKTIVVTGADGGIGSAIYLKLKAEGNHVIEVTRKDADLTSLQDIELLKNKIVTEAGPIDWMIFAHGFLDSETILENQTKEAIDTTFSVNIISLVYLTQKFLPHIPKSGGIVALSSTAGVNANGRYAAYSASKFAVNGFMQAMARNRPDQKFFSLCPGPTDTKMFEKTGGEKGKAQDPALVANLAEDIISEKGDYKSGDIIVLRAGEVSVHARLA